MNFAASIPACAFFFFFKVEISSHTLIPLFTQRWIHSGSASRDDCGRAFPNKLRVSSFPVDSHTMPEQRRSQLPPTSLGQECIRF